MRMGPEFYLFRHGLATRRIGGYGEEIYTAELLPEGIEQSKLLGQYLTSIKSDYNVSSEIMRCKQTVEIVSSISQHEFVFDKRLNEFHNETFTDFTLRVKDFIHDTEAKKYNKILVCTHGAVIAAITHLMITGEFTEANQLDYPETGGLRYVTKHEAKAIDIRNHSS